MSKTFDLTDILIKTTEALLESLKETKIRAKRAESANLKLQDELANLKLSMKRNQQQSSNLQSKESEQTDFVMVDKQNLLIEEVDIANQVLDPSTNEQNKEKSQELESRRVKCYAALNQFRKNIEELQEKSRQVSESLSLLKGYQSRLEQAEKNMKDLDENLKKESDEKSKKLYVLEMKCGGQETRLRLCEDKILRLQTSASAPPLAPLPPPPPPPLSQPLTTTSTSTASYTYVPSSYYNVLDNICTCSSIYGNSNCVLHKYTSYVSS